MTAKNARNNEATIIIKVLPGISDMLVAVSYKYPTHPGCLAFCLRSPLLWARLKKSGVHEFWKLLHSFCLLFIPSSHLIFASVIVRQVPSWAPGACKNTLPASAGLKIGTEEGSVRVPLLFRFRKRDRTSDGINRHWVRSSLYKWLYNRELNVEPATSWCRTTAVCCDNTLSCVISPRSSVLERNVLRKTKNQSNYFVIGEKLMSGPRCLGTRVLMVFCTSFYLRNDNVKDIFWSRCRWTSEVHPQFRKRCR